MHWIWLKGTGNLEKPEFVYSQPWQLNARREFLTEHTNFFLDLLRFISYRIVWVFVFFHINKQRIIVLFLFLTFSPYGLVCLNYLACIPLPIQHGSVLYYFFSFWKQKTNVKRKHAIFRQDVNNLLWFMGNSFHKNNLGYPIWRYLEGTCIWLY